MSEKVFYTFLNPHSSLIPLSPSTFTYYRHRKKENSLFHMFIIYYIEVLRLKAGLIHLAQAFNLTTWSDTAF